MESFKVPKARIESEFKIVHLMLRHRNVLDELLDESIFPELFDPTLQPIVKAIYEEYLDGAKQRLLTRDTFSKILADNGVSPAQSLAILDLYNKCYLQINVKTDDLGQLKKDLLNCYSARILQSSMEDLNIDIEKHGYHYALRNLVDRIQSSTLTLDSRRASFVELDSAGEEYIKQVEEARSNPTAVIRCGIPEIDNVVNVGFRPQHLTLFVGDIASHKTNVMLNIALNLYDSGHNILFLELEMDWSDLTTRILSNRTELNYDQLARPDLLSNSQVELLKKSSVWESRSNKFCIFASEERITVSALKKEIEKRVAIFKPAVVVVDYVAIMKPDMRFSGRNDLEIGEILKDLRFAGRKHGFHIITAAQMGRAAIKDLKDKGMDSVPDSTSVRGSHEYSADADTIFGLIKIPNVFDRIRITTIKSRHGKPSGGELKVDGSKCLVTSTSGMFKLPLLSDSDFVLEQTPDDISNSLAKTSVEPGKAKAIDWEVDLDL